MGNCCKSFAREESLEENPIENAQRHSEGNSMRSAQVHREGNGNERTRSCSNTQAITVLPRPPRNVEKREQGQDNSRGFDFVGHPGYVGINAELIAAGWPSWMVKDAHEAFVGWLPRKEESFKKYEKIGEGAYSIVYRAFDLEQGKFVALKKIKFRDIAPQTVRFTAREVAILRRLHHPNIVKLEGLVAASNSCNFYLILEYIEYDLERLDSHPVLKFSEAQVKSYMKQLFCGLDYCHRQGILHRDIKVSNLLVDTKGNLKIADFGLANFYDPQQGCPQTNKVVTLWYRPPELLLGATRYGAAIDLWSAGCILVELYLGRPIFRGKTEMDQLDKIFTLCGLPSEDYWRKLKLRPAGINRQKSYRRCVAESLKNFPAPALALIETLLSIDPSARQTATHALNSEYFLSEPLPYKPIECQSSLQAKSFVPLIAMSKREGKQLGPGEIKRKM